MPYTVPSQQLSSLSMFDARDARSPNQGHDLSIKGVFSPPTGDPLHPAETDEQLQQMGKKKRSKLGYLRTSVACVDQTSPGDSRAKKTSRSPAKLKGNSATSISNPVKQPRKPRPPFSPSTNKSTPIAVSTTIEVIRMEGFPYEMRGSLTLNFEHRRTESNVANVSFGIAHGHTILTVCFCTAVSSWMGSWKLKTHISWGRGSCLGSLRVSGAIHPV
ncbi:hypothetical protein H9L39_18517, partial [Fusarium oxysporum f. sp. albedinis]